MDFVYILLTLVLLSIMVVIHELGHFLFAKLFGVTVLEFSVGMGPAIFTTKKKRKNKDENVKPFEFSDSFTREDEIKGKVNSKKTEGTETENPNTLDKTENYDATLNTENIEENNGKTVFSIRALPIGGYVSMAGEDNASDDKNAFCNKKVWKRLIITLAGPVMNLLLGFLCVCILVGMDGVAGNLKSTTISYNYDYEVYGTPVTNVGENPLMEKDKIIKINNVRVYTANEVVYEIGHQGHEPVDITVIRNGETVVVKDVVFPVMDEGVKMGSTDFGFFDEDVTFFNVVKHSFTRSVSAVKMIVDSLVDFVKGRYGMEALSGPIGVSTVVGEVTRQKSFDQLLWLFAVITINLGIFNLIPFPALDGGRIIFLIYEGIFRKPVKKEVEQAINTVGLMLLMALAVFVMVKDIFTLF